MSGLLTITGLSGAGPSYTLTVADSSGVVTADHVIASLASDPSHGGVYRVTGVPTGASIDVEDDLVPGGGAYGSPATTGPGAFWTPAGTGISTGKVNNTPFWGDIVERDFLLGSSGVDGDAIHDNVAAEIAAVAEKVTPVSADLLLIEDSAAANAKKRIQIGNLPGGAGHDPWVEDEFTPTNGQVSFTLSGAPTDANSVSVIVNGTHYDDTDDFTVSGVTLTWLDTPFTLDTSDKMLVRFY